MMRFTVRRRFYGQMNVDFSSHYDLRKSRDFPKARSYFTGRLFVGSPKFHHFDVLKSYRAARSLLIPRSHNLLAAPRVAKFRFLVLLFCGEQLVRI